MFEIPLSPTHVDFGVFINYRRVLSSGLAQILATSAIPGFFNYTKELDGLDPWYRVLKSGSATKIHLSGRFLVLHSDHQIKRFIKNSSDIGDFSFAVPEKRDGYVRHPMTSIMAPFDEHSRFPDLCIHDYTDLVNQEMITQEGWFNITDQISQDSCGFEQLLIFGFPGQHFLPDYDQLLITSRPVYIPAHNIEPRIAGLFSATPQFDLQIDPSGLSGGPVFGVRPTISGRECYLLGIVTNASKKVINYLSIDQIVEALLHKSTGISLGLVTPS